jgi:import inner membrane translocase subunit TIM23
MNFGIKRGSMSAQSLGCIALLFSLYDWGISSARGVEDDINTVSSGVLTGITFTSPHGLRRMAYGGGFGLGLTLMYLAFSRKELIMNQLSNNN